MLLFHEIATQPMAARNDGKTVPRNKTFVGMTPNVFQKLSGYIIFYAT
ncbi:hypothetical protein [Rickettsia hoogstraalii]|nr:hypothetical protein [Rickettsia hoogstraalii]